MKPPRPDSTAVWFVGRWARGEYVDLPWYACDRGGWFGKGLPGRSFKSHAEAQSYADRMVRMLPLQPPKPATAIAYDKKDGGRDDNV